MLRAWMLVFKIVSCVLVCPVGHLGLVDSKKPLLELVDGHSLKVVGVFIHKMLIWHYQCVWALLQFCIHL